MKSRLQPWGSSHTLPIVSCLVFNEHRQLLLLKRHRDDLGGGKWAPPGGRFKFNETAEDAVKRELREETGLDDVSFVYLGVHQLKLPHGTVQMTTFTTELDLTPQLVIDREEHDDFLWLNLSDLVRTQNLIWGLPLSWQLLLAYFLEVCQP